MSRLVRLSAELLQTLNTLSAAQAHQTASADEQQFVQTVRNASATIMGLPDIAIPMDRSDELADARNQLRHAREDFDPSQRDLEAATRETIRLQRTVDRLLEQPAGQPANNQQNRSEKLPDIPMFGGKQSELRPWMDCLSIKIGDCHRYPNLQDQLRYALSRLDSTAFSHIRSHLQPNGTIDLASIEALTNILVAAFDDPDRQGTARRTILSIRQGNEDFSSFYAQFQDHVPYARMDDGALLAAMTEAISPKIRQAMITVFPAPATLAAYVEMARQIDARQRAENERRSGTTTSTTSTTSGRSKTTPPAPRAAYTAPSTATTATGTAPGPGPMDLS